MKHLVDLKITIRRSDWWDWERDIPFAINPYRPFPNGSRENDSRVMREMWEVEKQNPALKPAFQPKYWGSAFQHLPKLKTLTIEFETEKSLEAELDAIAQHAAKGWKFPLGERGVLSAEGCEIKKWEWEGPKCFLSDSQQRVRAVDDGPTGTSVWEDGKNPTLVVRTVRWVATQT